MHTLEPMLRIVKFRVVFVYLFFCFSVGGGSGFIVCGIWGVGGFFWGEGGLFICF